MAYVVECLPSQYWVLSSNCSTIKKEINKETSDLNYTIEQMDLTEIYRIFHPTATEYTFFSATHEIFYKIHDS
jgi:hypothetical protein